MRRPLLWLLDVRPKHRTGIFLRRRDPANPQSININLPLELPRKALSNTLTAYLAQRIRISRVDRTIFCDWEMRILRGAFTVRHSIHRQTACDDDLLHAQLTRCFDDVVAAYRVDPEGLVVRND